VVVAPGAAHRHAEEAATDGAHAAVPFIGAGDLDGAVVVTPGTKATGSQYYARMKSHRKLAATLVLAWLTFGGPSAVAQIQSPPPPGPPALKLPLTNLVPDATVAMAGSRRLAGSGNAVWVINSASGTLMRVDPKTNTPGKPVLVGSRPCARSLVAFKSVWVDECSLPALARLNPDTNHAVAEIFVPGGAQSVAFAEDAVWVAGTTQATVTRLNAGDGTVSRIDPKTSKVTSTITLGVTATGGVIAAGSVWVAATPTDIWRVDPTRVEATRAPEPPSTRPSVQLPIRTVASDGVPVDADGNPQYSTFSLCAVDPAAQQSGAAVTTRVPFVGRAVPHVRAGVGAVCTQASTRVENGREGLDLMAKGVAPADALAQLLAPDQQRESRQVGLIDMQGRTAAHTGTQNGAWAGSRQGLNYTVQANIMVGPEVVEAVANSFEATAGTGMPLAERMILAMEAGQAKGGDRRWGLLQSAAIKIADPNTPGRGGDNIALAIEVGEHAEPVAELKRIYYTTARRLGYRSFSRIEGADVIELKRMLHALGYWRPTLETFPANAPAREYGLYDDEAIAAVDKFRADKGLVYQGNPPGLVDERFITALRAAYFAKRKGG